MKSLPPLSVLAAALLGLRLLAAPPAPPPHGEQGPLLPRVGFLRTVGAGQQPLVADYYWLQTIQQIGRALTPEEFRDIYPYANLTTDLDPHFYLVYWYGAVTLPVPRGRGAWVNTAESTALLHKGLGVFPDDFRLNFQLAYNLQYFDHRYREAAVAVEKLSKKPGAPWFLAPLATRLFAQSGDFDAGLAMAEAMRDSTTDPEQRQFYENRILQLHQERVLQAIDKAAEAYKQAHGVYPADLLQLVASGLLREAPVDPLGGTLYLDDRGVSHSTETSHRLELYQGSETGNDS